MFSCFNFKNMEKELEELEILEKSLPEPIPEPLPVPVPLPVPKPVPKPVPEPEKIVKEDNSLPLPNQSDNIFAGKLTIFIKSSNKQLSDWYQIFTNRKPGVCHLETKLNKLGGQICIGRILNGQEQYVIYDFELMLENLNLPQPLPLIPKPIMIKILNNSKCIINKKTFTIEYKKNDFIVDIHIKSGNTLIGKISISRCWGRKPSNLLLEIIEEKCGKIDIIGGKMPRLCKHICADGHKCQNRKGSCPHHK